MIKAYLTATPSFFEGEDIEVIYSIYREGELLTEQKFYKNFQKPAVVEHFSLIEVLKELKKLDDKEAEIFFNNPSLMEQLNGTSTLKDNGAKKMIMRINDRIKKLDMHIYFTDISQNQEGMKEWNEKLDF